MNTIPLITLPLFIIMLLFLFAAAYFLIMYVADDIKERRTKKHIQEECKSNTEYIVVSPNSLSPIDALQLIEILQLLKVDAKDFDKILSCIPDDVLKNMDCFNYDEYKKGLEDEAK